MAILSKSDNMEKELKNRLTSAILSSPLVYIPHFHYHLLDEAIKDIIQPSSGYSDVNLSLENVLEFDCGRHSVIDFVTKKTNDDYADISEVTKLLKSFIVGKIDEPSIVLIKNFDEQLLDVEVQSLLSSFASLYEERNLDSLSTIIIMSPNPVSAIPLSLRNFFYVIEILPPNVDEIRHVLEYTLGHNPFIEGREKRIAEDLVRTLQGMQMYEVKQTLRTVFELTNGRLSSKAIREALKEKKKIVKKTGIIEVVDTDISFNDVGGLSRLVEDLEIKSQIYNNLGDAEKFNIPIPKGILIIGMPGCGKSMIAQATANKFGVSLLRLDVSRLMGKYVGESEANLRLALATAEAAHPCVLWIDEIEKAFAGGNNAGGDNDMLVMRMMGHFLTWMQERKTPVYIVATANDVMRPEFMRKGRFDEVYFVNFPEKDERAQILSKKIEKRYPQQNDDCIFDFSALGDCSRIAESMKGEYGGFSGAEIECVLNMVVEEKFTQYLVEKAKSNSQDYTPSKVKITLSDFEKVITRLKPSVMSNQKSKSEDKSDIYRRKTSIERILDMQKTYNFVNAKK